MNEDLEQWFQETLRRKQPGKQHKQGSGKRTKVTGKCHICGEKEAKARCIKCGRPVCSECYFHLITVCRKCVSKDVVEKWEQKKPDWEKTLGVEWID